MTLAPKTSTPALQQEVEAALIGTPEKQADAARDLLDRLAHPADLGRALETMLDDPEALRQCARKSYVHPNGFDKIVLASGDSGWKLRLNIWWPSDGWHTENIHNHRWNFASSVVVGRLETDFFAFDDDGDEVNEYVYRPAAENGAYLMEHNGTRRIRKIFSGTIAAGSSYSLERSALHRVCHSRQDLTATLMLHTAPTRETSVTLTPDLLFSEERNEAAPLTETTVSDRIRRFLER